MFILGNFLFALAKILGIVCDIMMFLIIIRALISWVNPDPYNAIVIFLNRVTEPILAPIRRMIPMFSIGIDISPIIAWLGIVFLKAFLVKSLMEIAALLQ
ncbi:MAG: YggT family protein [Candidatus Omnitrophica bacterium]|nr:YggT family protein [Candidatus Omnitrophota bacterium]